MNKHTKNYILNEADKHIETIVLDIEVGETTNRLEIYSAIRNDIDLDISKLSNIIKNYEMIINPKPITLYQNLHYSYCEINAVEVTDYVASVVSYLTINVIDK